MQYALQQRRCHREPEVSAYTGHAALAQPLPTAVVPVKLYGVLEYSTLHSLLYSIYSDGDGSPNCNSWTGIPVFGAGSLF